MTVLVVVIGPRSVIAPVNAPAPVTVFVLMMHPAVAPVNALVSVPSPATVPVTVIDLHDALLPVSTPCVNAIRRPGQRPLIDPRHVLAPVSAARARRRPLVAWATMAHWHRQGRSHDSERKLRIHHLGGRLSHAGVQAFVRLALCIQARMTHKYVCRQTRTVVVFGTVASGFFDHDCD